MMTPGELDVQLGRVMREYGEAKKRSASLEVRSSQIASLARKLANAFDQFPDQVHVPEGREGSMAFAGARFIYRADDGKLLSRDFVRSHLGEYQEVLQEKSRLRLQLKKLGHRDFRD